MVLSLLSDIINKLYINFTTDRPNAVSYTHLDVYKRQVLECLVFALLCELVEYPCSVDVFVCVVWFNEVVCKGGFCKTTKVDLQKTTQNLDLHRYY